MSRRMAATQFKAHCLEVLDHVDAAGIVITKHGKPVAKLMPIQESPGELIGRFKGKIKITGDIMTTGLAWDAES